MNLANLRTEAQRIAGRVDTDFNSRTRRWLNEAQERWALAIPWPTLLRTETFSCKGTQNLVLPQRVKIVNWVGDRTGRRSLMVRDGWEKDFPEAYMSQTPGAPTLVRELGVTPVTAQPATAGILSVKTTTSDVFGVYLGGLCQDTTASGTPDFYFFDEEKVDVNSSSVTAGKKLFVRIEVIGKDDFTPADVVIRDAASNIIARIPAHAYTAEYRQLEFLYVPAVDSQVDVNYVQGPVPMIEEYQVPHPSIKTEYLIWYAAALLHSAQGQMEQAAEKRSIAMDWLNAQIYRERNFGEKSYQGRPDQNYWGAEDMDEV